MREVLALYSACHDANGKMHSNVSFDVEILSNLVETGCVNPPERPATMPASMPNAPLGCSLAPVSVALAAESWMDHVWQVVSKLSSSVVGPETDGTDEASQSLSLDGVQSVDAQSPIPVDDKHLKTEDSLVEGIRQHQIVALQDLANRW